MTERRSASGLRKQDKGKAKVGEPSNRNVDLHSDDDQTMAASQENQSDGSGIVLPFKKRWANEANARRESYLQDDEIPQENTGAPSNTQQESQLKVYKIPHENTSAPSNQPKESKVEEDQVPLENTLEQSDRNVQGPGSRYLPREAYCLSKTLNSFEVIPESPQLYLDAYEASILTDCPEIVDYLPGSFTKNLLIFDGDNRQYDMLLSHYISGGWIRYSITAGWKTFVRSHNLKAGDEITFYRNLDRNVSDDYYYILKYFRKPADRKGHARYRKKPSDAGQIDFRNSYEVEIKHKDFEQTKLKVDKIPQENASAPSNKHQESKVEDDQVPLENTLDKKKRNVRRPGSRALSREAYCLSKTLTSFEVIQENPRLYLDAYEASILTDCPEIVDYPPGSYSKSLLMFDGDERRYNMLLSHYISEGKISYSLNGGWNRFVRNHNLKAGDEITFYRNLDTSVSDDYYYIIKYFRKPADIKGYVRPGMNRKKLSDDGKETDDLVIKLGRG